MSWSRLPIAESLADLAWSLWAELGVSGWERRHQQWCIDVEALLILTALLGDTDPRLRDESTDWCIRYTRLVSATRLKYLYKQLDTGTQAAFDEFSATVQAHSRTNWPASGPPRPFQPTGRSHIDTLTRPAHFGIRQRAIFGTSARAEIIRILAGAPDKTFTAAELADDAGYTKRAIDLELEIICLGGIVTGRAIRGSRRYRLTEPQAVLSFVGPRPTWLPQWQPLVRIFIGAIRLTATFRDAPDIIKRIEAAKFLNSSEHDIEAAGLFQPVTTEAPAHSWDALNVWLADLVRLLAQGEVTAFRPGGIITAGSVAQ